MLMIHDIHVSIVNRYQIIIDNNNNQNQVCAVYTEH